MGQTLDWQSCVVRIDIKGKHEGTGFFVASRLVLTCNHVVDGERASDLSIRWRKQSFPIQCLKKAKSGIDLVLLELTEDMPDDHSYVSFSQDISNREALKTFGYHERYPDGDPVTFEYEGLTGNDKLIKFKAGQVKPGLSGSPLVIERTNKVCGVIKSTRDRSTALGGLGIPTKTIFAAFMELKRTVKLPPNPFRPLKGPAECPDLFFGREKELKDIFEYLDGGTSVAIIGETDVGKSSLLKAIEYYTPHMLREIRRPVYLNLKKVEDTQDFYRELCEALKINNVTESFQVRRALNKLDPKILLILDEIAVIKEEPFRLARNQLIGLASDGTKSPLRLVTASRISLVDLFLDDPSKGANIKDIFTETQLNSWSEHTAQKFIDSKLVSTPIKFTNEDIFEIIQKTKCHPQKVMNYCFSLYKKYSESFNR